VNLKHFFRSTEDYHRLAIAVLAALIFGAEVSGVDTGRLVNIAIGATGAATTVYGLWVRSPKDDPTAPSPQSESVQD